MTEAPYSKRELDDKFRSLQDTNDAWNSAIVKQNNEILNQVKHTNGRLRKLEGARLYIAGGLSVITLILIPALAFLSLQILRNSGDIRELKTTVSIILSSTNRTPVR